MAAVPGWMGGWWVGAPTTLSMWHARSPCRRPTTRPTPPTRDVLHYCLEHAHVNVTEALEGDPEVYRDESACRGGAGVQGPPWGTGSV